MVKASVLEEARAAYGRLKECWPCQHCLKAPAETGPVVFHHHKKKGGLKAPGERLSREGAVSKLMCFAWFFWLSLSLLVLVVRRARAQT